MSEALKVLIGPEAQVRPAGQHGIAPKADNRRPTADLFPCKNEGHERYFTTVSRNFGTEIGFGM